MNQKECEKSEKDACLREKREDKKENTDMIDERKKDGEKDQSEKERLRAHETEEKHARERDRVSPSPGLLLLF